MRPNHAHGDETTHCYGQHPFAGSTQPVCVSPSFALLTITPPDKPPSSSLSESAELATSAQRTLRNVPIPTPVRMPELFQRGALSPVTTVAAECSWKRPTQSVSRDSSSVEHLSRGRVRFRHVPCVFGNIPLFTDCILPLPGVVSSPTYPTYTAVSSRVEPRPGLLSRYKCVAVPRNQCSESPKLPQ